MKKNQINQLCEQDICSVSGGNECICHALGGNWFKIEANDGMHCAIQCCYTIIMGQKIFGYTYFSDKENRAGGCLNNPGGAEFSKWLDVADRENDSPV